MGENSLGRILEAGGTNQIEVLYNQIKELELLKPVGDGPFDLEARTQASRGNLSLFGGEFKLDAAVETAVSVGTAELPLDDENPAAYQPPAGVPLATLRLKGELGLSGRTTTTTGAVKLSADVAAGTSFDLYHRLPVTPAESRLSALTRLARSTQLPMWTSFDRLAAGELTKFSADLKLDLGVQASYGADLQLERMVALFDDLAAPVKAQIRAAVEAAVGLAVYDRFDVIIDAKNRGSLEPDWVRIRVARQGNRGVTFGATFALAVEYDATQPFTLILDRVFKLLAFPKAVDVFRKINEKAAAGDWEAIKEAITDELDEALTAWAGPAWKHWVEGSDEVLELIELAQRVVRLYDGLGDRVKSLWAEVLAYVKLEEGSAVREVIQAIAAIDPDNVDIGSLLSEEWEKRLAMLETLTGLDVEELILGDRAEVREALRRARDAAAKLERLIAELPEDFMERVQRVASETGIEAWVDWLREHATSKEDVEAAGKAGARRLIERLVGKVWEQIDSDDLERVQKWAGKIKKVLDAPDEWNRRLRATVQKLKGAFGLSLGIEIAKVIEREAVLDLEFDPKDPTVRGIVSRYLRSGEIEELITALASNEDAKKAHPSFLIREYFLSTKRVRTSALSLLLPFLARQDFSKRRFEEAAIRGSDGRRVAVYRGGVTQSFKGRGATNAATSYLLLEAKSPDLNPTASYESLDYSLRLTFSREDEKTEARELSAIRRMLSDWGFQGAMPALPNRCMSRFAFEVLLTSNAVDALFDEIGAESAFGGWNRDYRNALIRWFSDEFVTSPIVHPPGEQGEILSAIVATEAFETSPDVQRFFEEVEQNAIQFEGEQIRFERFGNGGAMQLRPPFTSIGLAISKRGDRYARFEAVKRPLQQARATKLPADCAALTLAAARMFDTFANEWEQPGYNLWLILARLSRIAPASLAEAKGLASLRWRMTSNDPWDLARFEGGGIPQNLLRPDGTFPL
jgi:hypothetical protein